MKHLGIWRRRSAATALISARNVQIFWNRPGFVSPRHRGRLVDIGEPDKEQHRPKAGKTLLSREQRRLGKKLFFDRSIIRRDLRQPIQIEGDAETTLIAPDRRAA